MATTRLRRFWLEDQDGERVPLNGENKIWLSAPEGLGLEEAAKYAGNNGGFFLRSDKSGDKQATPKFKLTFIGPNPYASYRLFMDWMLMTEELSLVYTPGRMADTYRRRIEVENVEKGELNRVGWLECPLSFAVLSPWIMTHVIEAEITAEGTEPFRVGFGRVDVDRLSDGYEYMASVTVQPTGHLPASLYLTHTAGSKLVNPEITVTGAVSGTEYGRMAITGEVSAEETLEYSTEPLRSYIRARSAGGVRDLLPAADLAYEPYPTLPTDEPTVITMTTEEVSSGTMRVEVRQYRRTV